MPFRTNGRGLDSRRPFQTNYLDLRRPNITTKAVQIFNFPTFKTCGHSRATLRNAQAPGGCAVYLCRECWRTLAALETRAIAVAAVRVELANLFEKGGAR